VIQVHGRVRRGEGWGKWGRATVGQGGNRSGRSGGGGVARMKERQSECREGV